MILIVAAALVVLHLPLLATAYRHCKERVGQGQCHGRSNKHCGRAAQTAAHARDACPEGRHEACQPEDCVGAQGTADLVASEPPDLEQQREDDQRNRCGKDCALIRVEVNVHAMDRMASAMGGAS